MSETCAPQSVRQERSVDSHLLCAGDWADDSGDRSSDQLPHEPVLGHQVGLGSEHASLGELWEEHEGGAHDQKSGCEDGEEAAAGAVCMAHIHAVLYISLRNHQNTGLVHPWWEELKERVEHMMRLA